MAKPADHKDPAASGRPAGTGEHLPGSGAEPGRERQLVFVYGTLKRGEKNHHWLEGASWHGEAELPGVVLHDLGPFPMAVIGAGHALGEVYAVEGSGLAKLDELEGYPRLYNRQVMELVDGRRAWVYLGRPRQVRPAPVLRGGVWRP
jgi:gamma-glutamylcyclotransferase (GGCT)/AIG2-like uncharacterized protein YtfP